MQSRIETLIIESLLLAEVKFKDDEAASKYERYKNEFKELINRGILKERGNNLLSLSDKKSVSKIFYNS